MDKQSIYIYIRVYILYMYTLFKKLLCRRWRLSKKDKMASSFWWSGFSKSMFISFVCKLWLRAILRFWKRHLQETINDNRDTRIHCIHQSFSLQGNNRQQQKSGALVHTWRRSTFIFSTTPIQPKPLFCGLSHSAVGWFVSRHECWKSIGRCFLDWRKPMEKFIQVGGLVCKYSLQIFIQYPQVQEPMKCVLLASYVFDVEIFPAARWPHVFSCRDPCSALAFVWRTNVVQCMHFFATSMLISLDLQ